MIPGLGRSLEKEQLPTPVFWPGKFHELYGPWGHKESAFNNQFFYAHHSNDGDRKNPQSGTTLNALNVSTGLIFTTAVGKNHFNPVL